VTATTSPSHPVRASAAAGGENVYDAVIIGAGIAGLSAAWRLRHRRILLLEASDRVGGRMRSEPWGEYWLNYGAHLFPGPGTLVDSLITELGLETVPVWGSMMGLAVGDRKLTSGPVESYPLRLPLPLRDRVAFALNGLKVQRAVAHYHRLARPRPTDTPADTRARVLAHGDDRTFADFLGPLPAGARSIFACAAHRATAELDQLSAGCGIGLFALVWGGKGSLIARNLLGGPAQLPETMAGRLGPDRLRLNSPATAITPLGDELVIAFKHSPATQQVRARHVVLAAQAPSATQLAAEVAPEAADALAGMTYGAFLNVALATREQGPMPWDRIYAMATPGRVFDMFTNQAHALRAGERRPGGSLMLFAGGQAAAQLMSQPDEVIRRRFVEDLVDLFPEATGVIEEVRIQRWPLGNVFARPGRAALQQPLEGALGPAGNLHLAGDYFAELGNLEAAARTGAAAATRVDQLLAASPIQHPAMEARP
jgi:protoporphyrinogen/coproporphyrinogen III oxidase